MAQPKLVLEDEPTLGLAPLMARQIFELIGSLIEGGLTLLRGRAGRVTQSLEMPHNTLTSSKTAASPPKAQHARGIADDPRIRQAYLGL